MKARNGFISNSSSSSFAILGIKHQLSKNEDDDFDEFIQKIEKTKLEILTDDGSYCFIGKVIVDGEDAFEGKEMEIDEINIEKLTQTLKDLGFTEKIKIYCGTRSC